MRRKHILTQKPFANTLEEKASENKVILHIFREMSAIKKCGRIRRNRKAEDDKDTDVSCWNRRLYYPKQKWFL